MDHCPDCGKSIGEGRETATSGEYPTRMNGFWSRTRLECPHCGAILGSIRTNAISTRSQQQQQPIQTYGTLVADLFDEAQRYVENGADVYRAVADDFIRKKVGDDRTLLTFILHRSPNGPHRTYSQQSFDIDGGGVEAMKALAASALVSDMLDK